MIVYFVTFTFIFIGAILTHNSVSRVFEAKIKILARALGQGLLFAKIVEYRDHDQLTNEGSDKARQV